MATPVSKPTNTPVKPANTPVNTPQRPVYKAQQSGGDKPNILGISKPKYELSFIFNKDNYMWMFIGLGLILLGFFLMSGGKSPDPHKFNYDEIYSFRRITLAPIVILLGFAIEVYAIMKTPKNAE